MTTDPSPGSSSAMDVESVAALKIIPPPRSLIGKGEAATGLHLLHYGTFSDLTITCQSTTFKVHKCYLLARGGSFFQTAICGEFVEGHTSVIDLPEDDPDILARLLLYVYAGQYEFGCPQESGSQLPALRNISTTFKLDLPQVFDIVMVHIKIFAAAVKYDITPLRDQARKCFVHSFGQRAEQVCFDKFPRLQDLISAVYNTTPSHESELRDLCVIEAMHERENCKECRDVGSTTLLDTFEAVPEFCADMACCWCDSLEGPAYNCTSCEFNVNWIIRPCACKRWRGICTKKACVEARTATTVCCVCGAKGSLIRTREVAMMTA
ncbi:uncharacterized protein AB675_6367 [Cyphellophora attinorum]|uniref:BTB domain-containing protein n=1 Tax=Cyphellophora attinorum TaxID=1664694 RepID=A0A0N1HEV2_9EURO|nr:uncharacterized protein AB675_6367 [Phialophora attinorum]KPI44076.1 hypothetical protein AB675_6367 [Phialophora attinorum]